jgi:hypothetical protein
MQTPNWRRNKDSLAIYFIEIKDKKQWKTDMVFADIDGK